MTVMMTLCCISAATAQEDISNVRVDQHDEMLYITYDLHVRADVEAFVSTDGGETYTGPLRHVAGATGKSLYPEKDKIIMWSAVNELGYGTHPRTLIKVVAYPVAAAKAGNEIVAIKRSVYTSGGSKLIKYDVLNLMADNAYAMYLYNRGSKTDIQGAVSMYNEPPVNTEDLLISKNKKVYRYSESNMLVNTREKSIYGFDMSERIRKSEVRQLMADNKNALWLYNRGRSMNSWGNVCIIGGIIGIPVTIVGFKENWGNEYTPLAILDGFVLITGSILKISGINNVKKSVNMYNKGLNGKTAMEWELDFTGNGAKLALRF